MVEIDTLNYHSEAVQRSILCGGRSRIFAVTTAALIYLISTGEIEAIKLAGSMCGFRRAAPQFEMLLIGIEEKDTTLFVALKALALLHKTQFNHLNERGA